jgi:hypothetical protein
MTALNGGARLRGAGLADGKDRAARGKKKAKPECRKPWLVSVADGDVVWLAARSLQAQKPGTLP